MDRFEEIKQRHDNQGGFDTSYEDVHWLICEVEILRHDVNLIRGALFLIRSIACAWSNTFADQWLTSKKVQEHG